MFRIAVILLITQTLSSIAHGQGDLALLVGLDGEATFSNASEELVVITAYSINCVPGCLSPDTWEPFSSADVMSLRAALGPTSDQFIVAGEPSLVEAGVVLS